MIVLPERTRQLMKETGDPGLWNEVARRAIEVELRHLCANRVESVLEVYDARPEDWHPRMSALRLRRELAVRTGIDIRAMSGIWSRTTHRDILDRHRPLPSAEKSVGA